MFPDTPESWFSFSSIALSALPVLRLMDGPYHRLSAPGKSMTGAEYADTKGNNENQKCSFNSCLFCFGIRVVLGGATNKITGYECDRKRSAYFSDLKSDVVCGVNCKQ